jgi:ribonuclease HII
LKKLKIEELFDFDLKHKEAGYIIGTDEAGRGPGAGPVYAAAVCFKKVDRDLLEALSALNDSKQLSEKRREELFEVITKNSVYSVHAGSVEDIDKKNILNTSLDCMKLSCADVCRQLKGGVKLLVDGNKKIKNCDFVQETVVKGDSKSAAIAAASILAKVSRDRFMAEISEKFPQYNWAKNKGYLTAEHIEAVKRHGAVIWHRKKFLRKILEENNEQLGLFS